MPAPAIVVAQVTRLVRVADEKGSCELSVISLAPLMGLLEGSGLSRLSQRADGPDLHRPGTRR